MKIIQRFDEYSLFSSQDFFKKFNHFFDICDSSAKIICLEFVYNILPFYWDKLYESGFISKISVLSYSEESSFELTTNIFDILILFCQTNSDESIFKIFNKNILEEFINLLESESVHKIILLSELLITLINLEPEFYFNLFEECKVIDSLKDLSNSDVDRIRECSNLVLNYIDKVMQE